MAMNELPMRSSTVVADAYLFTFISVFGHIDLRTRTGNASGHSV
jgi:hypothetical protein